MKGSVEEREGEGEGVWKVKVSVDLEVVCAGREWGVQRDWCMKVERCVDVGW